MRYVLAVLLACAAALPARAQQYEMTTYVVGFLKRGPSPGERTAEQLKEDQKGHIANIEKMAKDGKLLLAGPFVKNPELRGMFVFAPGVTEEEIRKLTATDPHIVSGRLVLELHPWYSAKGINVPAPAAK